MTGRELLRRVSALGGAGIRLRGSHVRVRCRCGRNHTTVPVHRGADIPRRTLRAIERDLAPRLPRALRGRYVLHSRPRDDVLVTNHRDWRRPGHRVTHPLWRLELATGELATVDTP